LHGFSADSVTQNNCSFSSTAVQRLLLALGFISSTFLLWGASILTCDCWFFTYCLWFIVHAVLL